MKRWGVRPILTATLLLLGYWGWRYVFPGPEQIIRRRLADLARTACIAPNEGNLAKVAHAQKLTTFFTPNVEITIDIPGQYDQTINGSDELMRLAVMARSMNTAVKVEFVDVNVAVAPDQESAEAHFTGKANLRGEKAPEVQELKAHLRKVQGQWLIERAETVKTLR